MNKSSALRIRIDPDLHRDFLDTCRCKDLPASQVLRAFMRSYVKEYKKVSQGEVFNTQAGQKTSNAVQKNSVKVVFASEII